MADARLSVQVDAIGNFSNVIGEVGKFKTQLQNLKLPDKLTTKLEKGFDNVESKVAHFQSLLNKGITTKGDFSKLVSSARSAETAINGLKEDIKSIGDKDIQIAVANSADVKKAEETLQKILNMEKQLSSFGTSKGQGSFGEKEVANMQKLANTSEGLRKRFQDVQNSIKSGNIDQASAALERLIAHAQKYQAIAEKNGKETAKWDSTIKWAQGAQTQIDGLVTKANQAKAAFEQMQTSKFSQMKNSVDGIATGFNNVANNAKQAINTTTEMYSRTTQLNEQVSHLRTQANYFFGLQNMGRLIARGIREAAESVRDLDKAMTDTAVVTDFSVHDMWNMLPEYTKLANKLGATTQGAYETMTLYFQQGLNKTETFEIGEETMKMARIAGLDYAQTTNMMTAALRGFNMELNQTSAKRVNDVYSELAAITASDTRELGLAMERTASIAHSANMDFGNTTAFLAQMIETTREAPENLGTAMKTIIARFQELKQNPYEISEVEGEEVDFNRVDKALKSIGVDLMDNRDKFRDLDDVFLDISSRWDGLSQTTQRYIATIAAGARQQSRFLAMVQNYDRLKELTDAAANSEGASEVQFAKTLESYEAKVNKLKNAWQAFTMSLANNQAVKLGVDTLQRIITFGNKIIETFGKVGSVFGETGKGIAEMAAAFGLGALGFKGLKSGANAGLGILAKMTNANATNATKMFTGGFGSEDAATGKIATKITNPIVTAIDRVVAAINKEPFKTQQYQDSISRSQMLNGRQKKLYDLMSNTTDEPKDRNINERKKAPQFFSAESVNKQIADLTKEEQLAIKQNMPLLSRALQEGHKEAFKRLKLSSEAQQTVERYGKAIDAEVDRGNLSWSEGLAKKFDAHEVGKAIGGTTGEEIFKALDKELKSSKYTNAKYTEKFRRDALKAGLKDQKDIDKFIKDRQRQTIAKDKGKNANLNIVNTSGLNAAERKVNAFASTTSRAGQAVMGLGMAMSAAGFPAFGAIFNTIGVGIMGIGMAAEGAAIAVKNMGKAFNWIKNNPWVLAATAAIAGIALLIKHQKKMVQETRKAGNKVVQEYTKTTERTKRELDNIRTYQESWGTWIQGIDSNGNNIGLGTAEYEDYLKAVKEITNAHPELIKGYNSLGNAIVDNNTVLQEATKIAEKEQKAAEKAYLTRSSGQKIVEKQRTYKRWKRGNDNPTITAEEYARSGGSYAYDPRTKGSDLVKKATEVTNAVKALKGGDELLKQYGITFDKLGNITEQGIENLRVHGGDLDKALPNLFGDTLSKAEEKTANNINDKIAEFGEITSGLEEASKEYFDWGWSYAASKGYDKIDSNLLIPFKTSIERIAEKGLDAGDFQKEIDNLGKAYQDLGGHSQDFIKIQDEVAKAQEQFGKDLNVDAYKEAVTESTKSLDDWIKELGNHKDQASKILAEYLKSYKESVLNISENIPTLEEAFNTESGNISAANAVYDNWQKQNEGGDYYTAADNFHKMYEEVNDDIDNLNRGSQQWWSAMTATLGNDYVFSHTKDQIEKHAKTIDGFFKEGQEGADNFMRYLNSDNVLGKKLDPKFFPEGKTIGDYIIKDEDKGTLNFDKLMELTPDQMNSMANSADVAGEAWTAAFNKAMQHYPIDFANTDQMLTAIAAGETTLRGTGAAKDNMYTRLSDFQRAGLDAGATPEVIKENQKALEGMGVTFVDKLDKSNLSKYIKDWGISQGKKTQGKDEFNTSKAYDLIASLNKLGYNKDEISATYESNKDLISDYKTADFNQIYSDLKAAEDPATNSVMSIQGTTEGILSAVNSIALGMGILTKDSTQQIDNATEKANTFNDSVGDYKNYNDYKTDFDNTKRDLQATYDQLITAAEKHGDTAYGQELEEKAKEVKTALDTLGNGLNKQEFKDLQDTQSYADQLQSNLGTDGMIDIGQMLKIDPATLSAKGQELQQLFNQTFNADNTSLGLMNAANSAETLINTLSQSGQKGAEAAEKLKTSFLDANQNGLAKMDGAALAGVLNKLDVTKKDLQAIEEEHPEIDLDANVEKVDGKWQEKKQEIEENPIKAEVNLGSGKQDKQGDFKSFLPSKEEIQAKLQELKGSVDQTKPDVQVNTDKANTKLKDLIERVKDFKNSLKTDVSVGIDVSGAKKLNSATKNIKTLSNTKGKASVGLDSSKVTSGVSAASKLVKSFGSKTAKAVVGIKDNASSKLSSISSALSRFDGKKATATVNISPNYTGTWRKTVYVKEEKVHTGGFITSSGVIYRAKGGTIEIPRFKKKGTDTVPAMLTPGEYVQNRGAVDYFGIDFMRKINHKDLSGALQSFGSMAKGNRKGTLGPNNTGGLTLTGERGFEVAWIPSQNRSMILGTKGPQMIDLPKDTVIWSHEQSKKIIKNNSISAGSFGVKGTVVVPGTKNPTKTSTKNKSHSNKNSDKNHGNGGHLDKKLIKSVDALLKKGRKVTETAGKINLWWWNWTKKVEVTQRKIDQAAEAFKKEIGKIGITISSLQTFINKYTKPLNSQIDINKVMFKKAEKDLTTLDKGDSTVNGKVKTAQTKLKTAQARYNKKKTTKNKKAVETAKKQLNKTKTGMNYSTISYEVNEQETKEYKKARKALQKAEKKYKKSKKSSDKKALKKAQKTFKSVKTKKVTKKTKVNLAPYISLDEYGAYQVDYDKINKNFGKNKSKATAVGEEAKKKIEDLQSKKNTAEDNIRKAQEALEELGKQVSETFFQWENELTEVYNLTQQIESLSSFSDRFDSQIELGLSKLSAGFGDTVSTITDAQTVLNRKNNIIQSQIETQQQMIDARQRELDRMLSSADEQALIDKYTNMSDKDSGGAQAKAANIQFATDRKTIADLALKYVEIFGRDLDGAIQYNIDWEAFENARYSKDTSISEQTYQEVKKYLDDLGSAATEYNDSIKTQTDFIKQTYDSLREYQDYIVDFENTIIKGVEEQIEKETQNAKKISDSIRDGLKDLLDEVKNKLDERRKQEDNLKTERDISQKQQRLAALRADTSGGHQVEIAQLEKEIADAQQSYGRTLEDQLLDKMQQQADDAAKQRERQIELLETGNQIAEESNRELVNLWLKDPETYKEELKAAWLESQNFDEAGTAGQISLLNQWESIYTELITAIKQSGFDSINGIFKTTATNTGTLVDLVTLLARSKEESDTTEKNTKTFDSYEINAENAKILKEKYNASLEDLVAHGYKAEDLIGDINNPTFALNDIRKAGFGINDFINAGVNTVSGLHEAGFSAVEVKNAGFDNLNDYINQYSWEDIGKAFDKNEFKAANVEYTNARAAGFSPEDLKGIYSEAQQEIDRLNKAAADAEKQRKYNNYMNYLKAVKKISAAKVTSAHVNELFKRGSAAGYGKASVLKHLVGNTGGSDPFSWNNIFNAIINASGINRFNLVKTFGSNGSLPTAVKKLGNNPNTIAEIKKHRSYKNAKALAYKTGGLADYTGPAWLDGTPSKPELVLNAADTQNFLALKDVLSKAVNSSSSISNSYGDATYEININIDHINNDYDVDRMAERVKKIIVKDAGYRNVTQVRNFR